MISFKKKKNKEKVNFGNNKTEYTLKLQIIQNQKKINGKK